MFKNIHAGPNLVDVCFLFSFQQSNPTLPINSTSHFHHFSVIVSCFRFAYQSDDISVLGRDGISPNNDEHERNLLDLKPKLATYMLASLFSASCINHV